jgi:hypothetical protein
MADDKDKDRERRERERREREELEQEVKPGQRQRPPAHPRADQEAEEEGVILGHGLCPATAG